VTIVEIEVVQHLPLLILAIGFVWARLNERGSDGYFPRLLGFWIVGAALVAAVSGVVIEGGVRAATHLPAGSFFEEGFASYPGVLEFGGGTLFEIVSLLVLLAGVLFCSSAPLVRVRMSRVFLMQEVLLALIKTHSVMGLLVLCAALLICLMSSVRYHAQSLHGDDLAATRASAFLKYQGVALGAILISLLLRLLAGFDILAPSESLVYVDLMSLLVASMVIMGLFPFHGWVLPFLGTPRTSIFLPMFVVQLALLIFLRIYAPIALKVTALEDALLTCSVVGLLYASLLFFGEQRLKRITGYLYMSHISLMAMTVAGLKEMGMASSLLDAVNVLISTLGLLGVCSVLTSRFGVRGVRTPTGLGAFFPELAVCYLICVLSLVGFPGTLGFIEEEVMMGEGIGHHNALVAIFAVALTLNGFSSFRLFARVFYGQPALGRDPETGLLPRERCMIYCVIVLIVLNGLAPSYVVDMVTRLSS